MIVINNYENQPRDDDGMKFITGILMQILFRVEKMIESQDELIADLTLIKGVVVKIKAESGATLAKVITLEELLANEEVSPTVKDLVAEIKAGVASIDELVPDAPE
jgi:hypothetical protein